MNLELDDDEKAALIELLCDTIERDRFPLSPRLKRLRGIPGEDGGGLGPGHSVPGAETAGAAQPGASEETATFARPTALAG